MKQRIITSIVAVCVLLPVLFFHASFLLPLGVAVCSLIAVYEMLGCMGFKRLGSVSIPIYAAAAAFPFLIRYLLNRDLVKSIAFAAVAVVSLYLFGVMIFSHGKYRIGEIGALAFSILYILIGFNAILVVHDWADGGEYLYLVCFIGAWITDIFAYFCGMLFGRGGKHKLIPDVSPKKTVEGSIGGIVFCVLSLMLFGFIVEMINPAIRANLLIFAFAGVFVSVVAQVGDLSMSVIKRTYGIKDYGKLFPGHGGVLDRFDSVIAVSVVLLVFTTFFSFFKVM